MTREIFYGPSPTRIVWRPHQVLKTATFTAEYRIRSFNRERIRAVNTNSAGLDVLVALGMTPRRRRRS
jgi:hypothetical protein